MVLSEQVAPGCDELLALLHVKLQIQACQPFSLFWYCQSNGAALFQVGYPVSVRLD